MNNTEKVIKEMIVYHGFSSNTITGFSCYIPDPEQFSRKEGLLLFVCDPKRKRIETKFEHLLKKTRRKRLMQILNISEQKLLEEVIPQIIAYSQKLVHLGFEDIGKGTSFNKNKKIYNKALLLSSFENNIYLLKEFELVLIKNPLAQYAESKNLFTVKNKNSFLT